MANSEPLGPAEADFSLETATSKEMKTLEGGLSNPPASGENEADHEKAEETDVKLWSPSAPDLYSDFCRKVSFRIFYRGKDP